MYRASPKQPGRPGTAAVLVQRPPGGARSHPRAGTILTVQGVVGADAPGPAPTVEGGAAGRSTDRHEEEADRAAHRVVTMAPPDRWRGSLSTESSLPAAGSSSGRPLDPAARRFFEPRFGHDFSKVRIHAGPDAGESARRLGAQAYTVGNDIFFGAGEYRPASAGTRRLLGHELAHVVQQDPAPGAIHSRGLGAGLSKVSGGRVQRKLVATGETARFVNLANSLIAVQFELAISGKGEVSLRSSQIQGPPTRAAHELVSVLRTVINDPGTTTVRFAVNAARVTVGSYALSTVDLGDISVFGPAGARGLNAATALAHELLEQYRKQIHSESFPTAHAAGLATEARAAGATITPGNITQIDPSTTEIQDTYTYPDGTREEVTITLRNGNVTNVRRRALP